jgi:Fic family protein
MTYVLQLADDKHFGYSADLLRSLHYTMIGHDLLQRPGRWRPGAIFVQNEATGARVYEGPDVEQVSGLIEELVSGLNGESSVSPVDMVQRGVAGRGVPAMVRAAMAHLNLVMIHPYSGGNGRMARCLQSLVLARQGILAAEFLSIEEYLGRNQQDYYNVLATVGAGSWHPERDAAHWVRFCLTAHYRQAVTVLRRGRELQRMCDAIDEVIAHAKLPPRTFFALADTTQGLRLVNSRYRHVAEISQNLASRDLANLCQMGLLESHGEKRGRFYTAAAPLKDIRTRTREPRLPIPDPFTAEVQDQPPLDFLG